MKGAEDGQDVRAGSGAARNRAAASACSASSRGGRDWLKQSRPALHWESSRVPSHTDQLLTAE